jgi:hypothetical protein
MVYNKFIKESFSDNGLRFDNTRFVLIILLIILSFILLKN